MTHFIPGSDSCDISTAQEKQALIVKGRPMVQMAECSHLVQEYGIL